jgi:hypothetical protein
MFTELVIAALLAILFGLAWHDQPAPVRGREETSTAEKKTPER